MNYLLHNPFKIISLLYDGLYINRKSFPRVTVRHGHGRVLAYNGLEAAEVGGGLRDPVPPAGPGRSHVRAED